jgi:eukaryotic-like serine/threonine-protein kinase
MLDGRSMESDSRSGPTRVGRYWLFGAFASGGTASLHMGRLVGPAGFSRLVALKLLLPQYADDEHYTMLLDEARLSGRVQHPNVVQTLDVVHEDGRLCIVMQYVHGVDLATAVSAARRLGQRMPPAVASAIVVDVLQGLHAAHEARAEDGRHLGLVHRDVSPQNVVVGADGTARVLDFGIAKALQRNQVTTQGQVKGRTAYIAPEQLVGAAVTRQADVYSAGVVLWEALAGRHLFDESNDAAVASRVLEGQIPPPSTFAPEVCAELDAVTSRAVATERRDRFATALEMAEALAAAVTPASKEEVADWLRRVVGDTLDARTALMREVESLGRESGMKKRGARRAPRRIALTAAWLVVPPLAAVAIVVAVHRSGDRPATSAANAPVAPELASAPSRSGAPTEDQAPPPDSVAMPLAPAPVETSSATQPRARSPHHPPRATRALNCNPPYIVDANGIVHYKDACVK